MTALQLTEDLTQRILQMAAARNASPQDFLASLLDEAESGGNFQHFFEQSSEMLCISTLDGYFRQVNPTFARTLGYTPEEMVGKPFMTFVHPEDRSVTQMEADYIPTFGSTSGIFRNRYLHKEGGYRWLDWTSDYFPERGEIHSTARDVTEIEEARLALLKAHERIYAILESITDGFFALDDGWAFTYINHAAERLLGSRREHLLGRNLWEAYPELRESNAYEQYLETVLNHEAVAFTEFFPHLESWFEVSVYPGSEGLSVYFRDVSERKSSEEHLAGLLTELNALFDNSLDAIIVADESGRYVRVNQAAARMFGLPMRDLLGQRLFDLLPLKVPENDLSGLWEAFVAQGEAAGEIIIQRPTGETRVVDYRSRAHFVPNRHLSFMRDITERKQAEDALRLSDKILKQLPYAVMVTDLEGNLTQWMGQSAAIFGYSEEEVIGRPSYFLFADEPDPAYLEKMRAQVLAGETISEERLCRRKDGAIVPMELSASMVYSRDGQPLAVVGMARDITERKQAQALLELSENRFRIISQMTSDYAFQLTLAPNGALQRDWITEDSFLRMTGFTLEESEARGGWATLVHPDDLPLVLKQLYELLAEEGERRLIYRIITRSGEVRYVEGLTRSVRDETGEIRLFYGAARDITRREEAVQALRRQEARLQSIVNTSFNAIIVIDSESRILSANPAATAMFGYSDAEMVGQPVGMLMSETDHHSHNQGIQRYLETGEARVIGKTSEVQGQRKDGTLFPVSLSVSEVLGSGEHLFIGTLYDLTERYQVEQERHKNEVLRLQLDKEKALRELKTRFVSMLTHDLRNPLASAFLNLTTLQARLTELEPETQARYLAAVHERLERIQALMEDILVFSRVESGAVFEPEYLDADALCCRCVNELREGGAANLTYHGPGHAVRVHWDEELITRALLNLVSNALNYSPSDQPVQVDLEAQSGGVVLRVSDKGMGIPAQDQRFIFEAFHRGANVRQKRGTGLGLAIVKQVVELHGGEISFVSYVNAGTVFTLVLPYE